ncbi:MAG: hypothetical protein K6T73_06860 [Candidatus Bathyarchaeota archaeon]|nr:hypothetical protein [Candidatus Bathyarchaeota archaeon]
MKKKIVGFLMLILLLTSTLGMAFIIKPSLAKENESSPSNEDFIKKINEKTVNSNSQKKTKNPRLHVKPQINGTSTKQTYGKTSPTPMAIKPG